MKKTNQSANLASRFRMAMYGIMLSSLILAAACAEGGYSYQSPSYPTSSYPSNYYPDYYGPSYYPAQDPEYWRIWQDRQGGG